MASIIRVRNLYKRYEDVRVFEGYDLDIENNSFTVLAGHSGSGKSTLLNILGLLERPDSGDILWWKAKNVKPYSSLAQTILRDKMGYLFQNFALIENKTVEYNLDIAMHNVKERRDLKQLKMNDALHKVGLLDYIDKKVYTCSGGEQQRIALARLLLKPCDIILADEPTGSLDYDNKMGVLKLLKEMQHAGKTLVIATHDKDIIEMADTVVELKREQFGSGNRNIH